MLTNNLEAICGVVALLACGKSTVIACCLVKPTAANKKKVNIQNMTSISGKISILASSVALSRFIFIAGRITYLKITEKNFFVNGSPVPMVT